MVSGKNIDEKDSCLVNNSAFEEGEVWHISHSQEHKQDDEKFIDDSRYEVSLFDIEGHHKSKGSQHSKFGQDIELEIQQDKENDEATEDDEELSDEKLNLNLDRQSIIEDYNNLRQRANINLDPMKVLRVWETAFFIHSNENLELIPQNFFYVIDFSHINPERNTIGSLKRVKVYTAANSLASGQMKQLNVPIVIWPKKILYISYSDLEMYQITIQMWTISRFTFNQLYASVTLTLKEVLDNEPETSLLFRKYLPKPLGKDSNPRKDLPQKSFEVHRTRITLQLQEIFDYDIFLSNWSFLSNRKLPLETKRAPKLLRFRVPLSNNISRNKTKKGTFTTPITVAGYWDSPCKFVFTGTNMQLQNSYIVVEVVAYLRFGPTVIGSAIISLKSVESYPLARVTVKRVTVDIYKIIVGELIGNIFCSVRSTGHPLENIRNRPTQIAAGAALISQLNLKEQFLVVRLFKCDNLPIADNITGTSDPIVKVRWDGMTNISSVREKTRRPVYNQNLYFPVRILDKRELLVPSFRRKCLPVDILSKGPIILEVWNRDDASSMFLGSSQIDLNKLYTIGREDTRCLAEGLIDINTLRRSDGRPNFEGKKDQDTENELYNNSSYTLPFKTLVVNKKLPLQVDITTQKYLTPTIHFEFFFIPPMPPDVVIPPPPPTKAVSNIWKQLANRWNRDFHRWKNIYKQWFSSAPNNRNFNVVEPHPTTNEVVPLCAFISPIAVPTQIANEGSLLHWISNFLYITTPQQLKPPGRLPKWHSPNLLLVSKKGGIGDHALLLCSCLLGMGYDAYVCRGTIENGTIEHVWVMSRHKNGHIQFWEVTTKQRYVLPRRYGMQNFNPIYNPLNEKPEIIPSINNDDNDVEEPDDLERVKLFEKEREYYNGIYLQQWFEWLKQTGEIKYSENHSEENTGINIWGEFFVPDVSINPEIIDTLNPVEENDTDIGERRSDKVKFDYTSLKSVRRFMSEYIKNIPIIPMECYLTPELISYVPYSSIEIIFNHRQVWGNLGNHHPALISYDLNNSYRWRAFCGSKPDTIFSNLIIEPPLQGRAIQKLEERINEVLEESISLNRSRLGLDTLYDRSDEIKNRIDTYLTLLEFKLNIDLLYDPGPPCGHTAWSAMEIDEGDEVYKEINQISTPKKKNSEKNIVSFQIHSNGCSQNINQDPQMKYINTSFYGSQKSEISTESASLPKFYTSIVINTSNKNQSKQKENINMRNFATDFPSLDYDSNPQIPNPYKIDDSAKAIKNTNFQSAPPSDSIQASEHSTLNVPDFTEAYEHPSLNETENIFSNKFNQTSDNLKQLDLINLPPISGEIAPKITDTTDPNFDHLKFTMGNIQQNLIEKKSSSVLRSESDNTYDSINTLYWNTVTEDVKLEEAKNKSDLPTEGVNLAALGMKSKITKWNTFKNTCEASVANIIKKDKTQIGEDEKIEPPPWRKLSRSLKYEVDQRARWNWYYRMEQLYYDWQACDFPALPKSTFTGFPVHFSTADPNDIRPFIVGARRFKRFIELPQDEAHFFVYTKIFPLVGGIMSTWIFLGVHLPWATMNEIESRMKRAKKKITLN
ncbi:C2 domain-containing protein [Cryptosporidium serpentis]